MIGLRMRRTLDRSPGVATALLVGVSLVGAPARAEPTPPSLSAAQPSLPPAGPSSPQKCGSPVVNSIVGARRAPLEIRKRAAPIITRRHHHFARRGHAPLDLDRPALAGVELLLPLPAPAEPPHIVVPLPAYPLDSVASAFLTPPPPVVCHRTPRVRDAPAPRLYREVTLDCRPDNP